MRLRSFLAAALLVPGLLLPGKIFAATQVLNWEPFTPHVNEFAAAIVMVPGTHQVLYSFKPDKPHTAASLTKLAGAMAFLKNPGSWERLVTLTKADEVGGGACGSASVRESRSATSSIRVSPRVRIMPPKPLRG